MTPLFPYSNIIVGTMILIVGFGFHWVGQLISIMNWELAERFGLQEKNLTPQYKVYEHAMAAADSVTAWVYGVAAVGLIMNADWGYELAWIPGAILIYHAISAWVWEKNRRKMGHKLWSETMRIGWCSFNAITGILAIAVAWTRGA